MHPVRVRRGYVLVDERPAAFVIGGVAAAAAAGCGWTRDRAAIGLAGARLDAPTRAAARMPRRVAERITPCRPTSAYGGGDQGGRQDLKAVVGVAEFPLHRGAGLES